MTHNDHSLIALLGSSDLAVEVWVALHERELSTCNALVLAYNATILPKLLDRFNCTVAKC